jgi:hypothetical protein
MVIDINKWQALDAFWNSFGIPAYDQNSIPDNTQMPYITYEATVANFDKPVMLNASLWYRQTSWKNISDKADQIAKYIGYCYKSIPFDGGYLIMYLGTPFAQRMSDVDDTVKRIYLTIDAEFCSLT